tara:strand:+ start:809 stop:979 length:171 start_codon:yes stop_codon:yes gene_type:complete
MGNKIREIYCENIPPLDKDNVIYYLSKGLTIVKIANKTNLSVYKVNTIIEKEYEKK